FPSNIFDAVVTTLTMCSIEDIDRALAEIHRTLKPGGQLLFLEHGRANNHGVTRWQDLLTLITRPLNGGCRINRPIATLIRDAGFDISQMRTAYAGFIKPFVYMYEGIATPK